MAARAEPVHSAWLVALLCVDGKQYVYLVLAPDDALLADLFWSAFHCHEQSPLPRASAAFDSAEIWQQPECPE